MLHRSEKITLLCINNPKTLCKNACFTCVKLSLQLSIAGVVVGWRVWQQIYKNEPNSLHYNFRAKYSNTKYTKFASNVLAR